MLTKPAHFSRLTAAVMVLCLLPAGLGASVPSGILVYCYGPVNIQMVDSSGRITGQDIVTGEVLRQIPGSVVNQEASPGRGPGWTIRLDEPDGEGVTIRVEGIADGMFVLDVDTTRTNGVTRNLHQVKKISLRQSVEYLLTGDGLSLVEITDPGP